MMSDGLKKTLEQLRQTLAPAEESARTDGQLLASFVASRDESAFAALVRRHGRMVFGVCRRVLGHVQDAEDAFQATFLVLACKASSLRDGEAVGNWLYGVAYRTALESKTRKARRHSRERPLDNVPSPEVPPEEPRDWLPLLEQALNGLPQRYRTPLVLCHLEGRSRQEVAHQLGLPEGTLSSRLATARQLLAKRLARHRLALPMGVILATLADETASAAVPASLLVSMVQDALRIAAGQTVATPAAVLMKKVLQMMLLTKLKVAGVFLAAVGVIGVLAASFFAPMRAADDKPVEPKPALEAKKTLATKITHHERDLGDVAPMLGIVKRVCEVELQPRKGPGCFHVVVEIYKDGKKRKSFGEEDSHSVDNPIRAQIALLGVDLDHLPLNGGDKKHCRMQLDFNLLGSGGSRGDSSVTIDIEKELFDFGSVGGGGIGGGDWFPREAGSATETPLFWLVARSNRSFGDSTVSGVIKKNPKGDLLIAYLRERKQPERKQQAK
jgi:RNA polymerase sigma factor (sigma-70 family)